MPAAVIPRTTVVDRLTQVFRREGFAGASLTDLCTAAGVGKSSLYNYFPDGKDDMARAVLDQLAVSLRASVFVSLRGAGSPRARIDAMIATLDAFYRGGREACLLGSLAVGDSCKRFRAELQCVFNDWIDSITAVLRDAGFSRVTARTRAMDAVIRIEGALVVAAALGDVQPFTQTLRTIKRTLLAKSGSA